MIAMAWIGAVLGAFAMWWLWSRRTRAARIAAGVMAVFYVLGVWAFLAEPKVTVARHVTVVSPAWTGPPIRIAVLSDTHVGDPHVDADRVARLATRINREAPDAAVFVGDYVAGHRPRAARTADERAEIANGVAALGRVRAPTGRAAVLGNHDWWYDGPAVETELRRAGITVLENEAVRLRGPGGGAFWIAGAADLHSARAKPSVEKALGSIPPGEPVILLTHWPDVFAGAPPRVALTIAAHSHCGQVNFPFVGRPITPSAASARWPCGLYDEGGRKLFVTGGLGTSVLPVRFRAPPEFVIVTLRGRP